ncbi:SLAP domain-containing protein, partial [Lactobacillus apis]|uniref:SLAP domain-containing protein n=1 Tax=Lactobacillus apis TaxID=303541 RepID=UPI00164F6054
NGSGSNGSGSNGSESNGSESNGSGSNGSESNGSGSNGSESNGSGSNGSDSNGSESNGSGSNGSGSNGSESNGSGSNGSGSNGSESNGSGSNGSDSNGSGSNGSNSNGSSNNSGNSGSGSNNSGSNNSSNAGTGSAGSGVNASGSNGSATSEGTSGETAGVDASKAVDKTLTHNAYFYDKNGNRANLLVAKKGSTISTFGTQKIGNRDFYLTDDGLYVAVNNFIGKKRTLKKNAFVYNKNGKRVGTKLLKKNAKVTTYGDPVSINGKSYFIIDNNRYVKAANFASAAKEANNVLADGVTSNATLGHDAYIYNGNGQRVNKVILKSGSQVTTGETKTVNGRQFVEIGKDQYLDSDNVTGTTRTLTSSAAVYNKYGKRVGSKTINKGENVQTFGSVVAIQGVAYYSIGNGEFVKQTAFE